MNHKYLIKKNKHYKEGIHIKFHYNRRYLTFIAKFSNNCWWNPPRNNDDFDINKLFGLSYGYHKKNSIRIGWIPDFENRGIIKLYAYWYNKSKKFNFKYLCDVPVENYFQAIIEVKDNFASFKIDGIEYLKTEYKLPFIRFGYFLYPYFGGNNKAPNDLVLGIDF